MIVSQSFVIDFHSFLFVFFLFLLYPLPYLTSVLRRKQKTCMRLLYPLICARVLAAVKCGQALFFFLSGLCCDIEKSDKRMSYF